MMDQYTSFAYYYDILMEDIDYNVWVDYLEELFERYHINPELILELGCGTGNVTLNLAKRGYDTIGIDISLDMLNIAKEKAYKNNLDILFLNQDMREFELYGTVDIILCLMDSINYITNGKDILEIFKLVHNYLNSGGLFIFDINTYYKLKKIIGENTYVYDKDEVFCVWESYFEDTTHICDFYLTFFGKEEDKYTKYNETHHEKAYTINELKGYLANSKLDLLDIFDEFSFVKPAESSERIFFIVRKN